MSTRELTPPFDGAVDRPVRKGWYPSAWKSGPNAGNHPSTWPRRYWNGKQFGNPVHVGDSGASVRIARMYPGMFLVSEMMWCGLTAPYRK